MLVICNAIYVHTIEHNLLQPLILREALIKCNDTLNIHVEGPGVDDHDLSFAYINLHIPLQLWGILFYFHTRVTNTDDIIQCNKVLLTLDGTTWDNYS